MANRDNVTYLNQYGNKGWKETRGKIYKALMAGEDFQSGAMKALRYPDLYDWDKHDGQPTGELPKDWYKVLVADSPDYVVYSYDTPIAWHVPKDGDGEYGDERWVVPEHKYSGTTTRHQNLVLTALVFDRKAPVTDLRDGWFPREER